jgi:hypothetical protein
MAGGGRVQDCHDGHPAMWNVCKGGPGLRQGMPYALSTQRLTARVDQLQLVQPFRQVALPGC